MQKYWSRLPLDAQVFTRMANQLGAPNIHILETTNVKQMEKQLKEKGFEIYGLIFANKWNKCIEKREATFEQCEDVFFARQIVCNACPTQTIISILLNAPIVLEGHLESFYNFAKYLNYEDRGLALSNSEAIRKVHNNISKKDKEQSQSMSQSSQDQDYHYVAFVPYMGKLYELDGLRTAPIFINNIEKQGWLEQAAQEVQRKAGLSDGKSSTIIFVCEQIVLRHQRELQKLKQELAHCQNIARQAQIFSLTKQKETLIQSLNQQK